MRGGAGRGSVRTPRILYAVDVADAYAVCEDCPANDNHLRIRSRAAARRHDPRVLALRLVARSGEDEGARRTP
ncbi:hypothetical protein [Methylobacterium sp. JK268]